MSARKSLDSERRPIHQLVLIRGLAREARHWGAFVQDLISAYADRGVDARVETIDLPGCGRHSEMSATLTIDQTADFAREKMKEILNREAEQGLPPADHRRLIAISLGGMVAASWLAHYPTDFHSAVLINSSFRGVSKFHERLKWQSWWRVPRILRAKDVEKREALILDWTSNVPERRAAVLEEWIAIQHSRPVSTLNLSIQLTAAMRFEAPVKLPVPVYVIASEKDRMVDPRCSQAIAMRYDSRIHFHPTAGHDLALDDGPWLARMIAGWKQI